MPIAITTTILRPDASFSSWLDHHLRRVDVILVYMDDPDNAIEDLDRLRGERQQIILRNGSQVAPDMSAESRIMLRQESNTKDAIAYLLDRDFEWILHIDSDELLYEPGGETKDSWSRRRDVGSVRFTNHEALPLSTASENVFRDCIWFRFNSDSDSRSHFMAYGNGKSAARLTSRVEPAGPHGFSGYRGQVYEPPADEVMILHYPTPTYERWIAKYKYYGEFGDYWYGDERSPNRVEFMLKSRDVVQDAVKSRSWRKAKAFWDERVTTEGSERWRNEVKEGKIRRYAPLAEMTAP
ncbi:hypothetical protein LTR91_017540 [Friedmanniomyces endolithicus]|uniref:Glycosyltransferase family 2 protein n=1 Tax=Friedmanniomyces endolithicus TaxID=329885 RepID=A0A4V5N7M7_9PEZI|nr:hypothetical protein LTS09_009359 [Friedmanniomyces endolithicus]KAK0286273.1 hypothetical protein LTR35_004708 [Friedmanniomyces endolithicus]KAK0299173.1 hypothetical protein LTS00_002284 [Friedmanniomyces endolithicus]KAK0306722.1 hypothetical protein LTR01_006017 [Friedmanniomyces endolithicus]KAK0322729.1 hypothetical protein LTR82_006185 [Friedmanniomyces endolithicus]